MVFPDHICTGKPFREQKAAPQDYLIHTPTEMIYQVSDKNYLIFFRRIGRVAGGG